MEQCNTMKYSAIQDNNQWKATNPPIYFLNVAQNISI